MKSAALSNGSGPGSSIALSPTSIRVRDAIIEKFIDKSLDELNIFLTSALDTERDESKRIGILAARVYILRTRISKIIEFNQNSMIPSIDDITPNELVNKLQPFDEPIISDEPLAKDINHLEEWNELLTLEDGEINGVRIPRGVAITVGRDDASRLIETGKAELIKEEEETAQNTTDKQDAMPDAGDMPDQESEAEIEAAEKMPVEQTDEISADDTELTPKTTVEDLDMPAAKTIASDVETKPKDSSSSEDTQSDDVDEAEIDDTKPKT